MTRTGLAALAASIALSAHGSPNADQIKRGEYMVRFGSCNDCHTPWKFDPAIGMPAPDLSRMLSGHPQGAPDPQGTIGKEDIAVIGPTFTAFRLPFGVVYARNLTPEKRTGLGEWTKETFIRALRTGRHMGGTGRPILPPMPWNWITIATDEDLMAIFAYLRTIPAVVNEVPDPKVPDEALAGIAKVNDGLAEQMKAVRNARKKRPAAMRATHAKSPEIPGGHAR